MKRNKEAEKQLACGAPSPPPWAIPSTSSSLDLGVLYFLSHPKPKTLKPKQRSRRGRYDDDFDWRDNGAWAFAAVGADSLSSGRRRRRGGGRGRFDDDAGDRLQEGFLHYALYLKPYIFIYRCIFDHTFSFMSFTSNSLEGKGGRLLYGLSR